MRGLTVTPIGKKFIKLKKTNERFEMKFPHYSIHNIIVGETYIWFNGSLKVIDMDNGDYA